MIDFNQSCITILRVYSSYLGEIGASWIVTVEQRPHIRVTRFIFPSLNIFCSSSISPTPSFSVDLNPLCSPLCLYRVSAKRGEKTQRYPRRYFWKLPVPLVLGKWLLGSCAAADVHAYKFRGNNAVAVSKLSMLMRRGKASVGFAKWGKTEAGSNARREPSARRIRQHCTTRTANTFLRFPSTRLARCPLRFFLLSKKKFIFSLNNRNVIV